MRRLGVFVYFNEDGVVEKYVQYLLKSFDEIFEKCIVLVNGYLLPEEVDKMCNKYQVIFRQNKGYDIGAYRDFFLQYCSSKLEEWDEIVLFNATFYGPFISWKNIFQRMEKENCDFWGLSKHLEKRAKMQGELDILEHIQSYFIVIRRKMFMSRVFLSFWKELEYAKSFNEVVNQEIHFTPYFKKEGYKYVTWLELQECQEYANEKEILYLKYPYELICKCKFPILKIKALNLFNFIEAKKSFEYIKENTSYDESIILSHIDTIKRNSRYMPIFIDELEEFVFNHKKIYFFGHGLYATNLAAYFKFRNWCVEGFLVTNAVSSDEITYDEFRLEEDSGIIVAVGKKNMYEVVEMLKRDVAFEHLLLPRF